MIGRRHRYNAVARQIIDVNPLSVEARRCLPEVMFITAMAAYCLVSGHDIGDANLRIMSDEMMPQPPSRARVSIIY